MHVTIKVVRLVGGRDDVGEQFGTDLGGGHVAQLVEDEQVNLGQLGLELGLATIRFDFGGSTPPSGSRTYSDLGELWIKSGFRSQM